MTSASQADDSNSLLPASSLGSEDADGFVFISSTSFLPQAACFEPSQSSSGVLKPSMLSHSCASECECGSQSARSARPELDSNRTNLSWANLSVADASPTPFQTPAYETFAHAEDGTKDGFDFFQFISEDAFNDSTAVPERTVLDDPFSSHSSFELAATSMDEVVQSPKTSFESASDYFVNGGSLNNDTIPCDSSEVPTMPILQEYTEKETRIRDQHAQIIAGMLLQRKSRLKPRRVVSDRVIRTTGQMSRGARSELYVTRGLLVRSVTDFRPLVRSSLSLSVTIKDDH